MLEEQQPALDDLTHFLTWKRGDSILRRASLLQVAWVFERLSLISNNTSAHDLYALIRTLPKASQQRLIFAPRTVYLLQRASGDPQCKYTLEISKMFDAERYLCRNTEPYPANSWTALCDCYFPDVLLPPAGVAADFEKDVDLLRLPKLGPIVLDGVSPYCIFQPFDGLSMSMMQQLLHHNPEELSTAAHKVNEAMSYILAVDSTPRTLIETSVQVIALSKDINAPGMQGSLSNRAIIGTLGLINAHSERYTIEKLANALIHEAIHSLIYRLELTTPLYENEHVAEHLFVTSPWSGRTLRLHSFVHACFVWFGLWCFWIMNPADNFECERLRRKSAKGFLSGSPLTNLPEETHRAIRPYVRDAIQQMHSHVVEQARAFPHTH